jgi:hypothetical protein
MSTVLHQTNVQLDNVFFKQDNLFVNTPKLAVELMIFAVPIFAILSMVAK